ncbi:MAG TPA: EamA family transporter [Stellaceae bacterium]|nr:EamA family transporter [Stellaceae bacterium]
MPALLPYYAALAAAIAFGVGGQVLLKTGSARTADLLGQFLDPFTALGLAAYGLAAILYIVAIKKIPVSLAFPSVSFSYIAVALIAHYAWGEPLGLPQLAGIALIILGLVLLHQG